jgi:hypothetical protein
LVTTLRRTGGTLLSGALRARPAEQGAIRIYGAVTVNVTGAEKTICVLPGITCVGTGVPATT